MPTLLTAGGATVGAQIVSATDGAITIQSGPDGSKVNALAIDASGNTTAVAVNGTTMQQGGIAMPRMVLSTAQNTTSGTSIDFTSIPSWVKRITVMLNSVSLSGTAGLALQIGSGSVETSGYVGSTGTGNPQTGAGAWPTDRMTLQVNGLAAQTNQGIVTLVTLGSNIWVESGLVGGSATDRTGNISTYTKTTAGVLDRLRLTTTNGTDTFDAGSVNILYEG